MEGARPQNSPENRSCLFEGAGPKSGSTLGEPCRGRGMTLSTKL